MKLEKRRQILFFVSLIGIIIVILIMGTTYAYQTLQVDYKDGSDKEAIFNVTVVKDASGISFNCF